MPAQRYRCQLPTYNYIYHWFATIYLLLYTLTRGGLGGGGSKLSRMQTYDNYGYILRCQSFGYKTNLSLSNPPSILGTIYDRKRHIIHTQTHSNRSLSLYSCAADNDCSFWLIYWTRVSGRPPTSMELLKALRGTDCRAAASRRKGGTALALLIMTISRWIKAHQVIQPSPSVHPLCMGRYAMANNILANVNDASYFAVISGGISCGRCFWSHRVGVLPTNPRFGS